MCAVRSAQSADPVRSSGNTARVFEELGIWRDARVLATEVYRQSASRPFAADFALRDQIRSAAISAMSNIAEGFERYSRPEFKHFLSIARGSAGEIRSLLHLAHDLGYLDDEQYQALRERADALSRKIGAFRTKLGT